MMSFLPKLAPSRRERHECRYVDDEKLRFWLRAGLMQHPRSAQTAAAMWGLGQ
jgi:hypothetical protein